MKILNLLKKKTEQEPIAPVTPTNPKYNKTSQMLTANDIVDYREQRNAIFKGFQQTIDKIHADIKDNPSDPMLMIEDKTFLIKKSDFINAKVVITSYHKDDSAN